MVGVATAFTGKYKAVQFLIRFLELLEIPLVKSRVTKPEMIEAGSTIASAEYCLPLRAYVGHIYHLLAKHPEIDILLTPIVKGEYPSSNTCAKYRDLDGVIIRSLGSISGYRLKTSKAKQQKELHPLIGRELTERIIVQGNGVPRILAPEIESLEKSHLWKIAVQTYGSILEWSPMKTLRMIAKLKGMGSEYKGFSQLEGAFEQAYQEIVDVNENKAAQIFSDPSKPRLALVGRQYLIEDPALSADIKKYFTKQGVAVVTIQDIPFSILKERYEKVQGFYDTHLLGQAFIDTVMDQVDGYIVIGSFGCHPDAFQVDYFSKYISSQGKACWTFKFDEQTGGAGFHTRYETILGFLEQKRNERLASIDDQIENNVFQSVGTNEAIIGQEKQITQRKPLFIWPYMGEGLNLALKELLYQLGLSDFLIAPKAVNEETIEKGNRHYTETCSPFALSLGSMKQTLDQLIGEWEEAEKKQKYIEPRRIIFLMAKGKGPCTFGWYSIAEDQLLKEEYGTQLAKQGHSIEMFSLDNQGRNVTTFLQDIASVSHEKALKRVIQLLDIVLTNQEHGFITTKKAEIELIRLLKKMVWPSWKKLLAFENIQNKALFVRAHELEKGITTKIVKEELKRLDQAHHLDEIERQEKLAISKLEGISQDKLVKPRVVIVGEIYVALTPFANRGTVDLLLGSYGIEAVEGMRLSHFIKGAFKGLKYHFFQNQSMIKPILEALEKYTYYQKDNWVREPLAKPFLEHEIGGDGQPTIAHARHHIEEDGVDGIVHIYPFKCMPEGIAKDALKEMCQIYGTKSLHLTFDRETEIERLKTEIGTFAALLFQDLEQKKVGGLESDPYFGKNSTSLSETRRRREIGQIIEKAYYSRKE